MELHYCLHLYNCILYNNNNNNNRKYCFSKHNLPTHVYHFMQKLQKQKRNLTKLKKLRAILICYINRRFPQDI